MIKIADNLKVLMEKDYTRQQADNLRNLMNKGYTRQQATNAVAGILPPKQTYTPTGGEAPQPFSWGQIAKNTWNGSQIGQIAGGVAKAYDWATTKPTPPNHNAGFMGVPATTSFYEQLANRDGTTAATQAIDSARAYQRDHPTQLPASISPYIPTYSTEDVNHQFPIVIKERADDDPKSTNIANAAAYYSYQDDNVSVRPPYASSMATGPTTANNYMTTAGTHELTHAITPYANAYRRNQVPTPWWQGAPTSANETTFNPQAGQDRALLASTNQSQAGLPKDLPHDKQPSELSSELSDYKKRYAESTHNSTIMDTPERQKAFRDWAHSKANPRAVQNPDGSYAPPPDSVWGQMNQLTPEQQSYLMGAVAKGQTPQQPAYGNYPTATPYSQYQA